MDSQIHVANSPYNYVTGRVGVEHLKTLCLILQNFLHYVDSKQFYTLNFYIS